MSKLPRTYYAPDRYDYDGDMESAYEDYRTYFDDSVNGQSNNQVKHHEIRIHESVEPLRRADEGAFYNFSTRQFEKRRTI